MRCWLAALFVLAAVVLAGCAGSGGDGDGACVLQVTFEGHVYQGVSVGVTPVDGESVGQGILPGCAAAPWWP